MARPAAAASSLEYQNAGDNRNGSTNGKANGHVNGAAASNSTSALQISGTTSLGDMDQSLRAAVEIAQRAEAHAAAHSYSLRFTSEDVRAIALSLFIARTREGGTR